MQRSEICPYQALKYDYHSIPNFNFCRRDISRIEQKKQNKKVCTLIADWRRWSVDGRMHYSRTDVRASSGGTTAEPALIGCRGRENRRLEQEEERECEMRIAEKRVTVEKRTSGWTHGDQFFFLAEKKGFGEILAEQKGFGEILAEKKGRAGALFFSEKFQRFKKKTSFSDRW